MVKRRGQTHTMSRRWSLNAVSTPADVICEQ